MVVAIIAILAAILLPALLRAKFKARTTVDLNDQKQWGMRLMMYGSDNNDFFYNEPQPAGNPSIHDVNENFEPAFYKYGATDYSFFLVLWSSWPIVLPFTFESINPRLLSKWI